MSHFYSMVIVFLLSTTPSGRPIGTSSVGGTPTYSYFTCWEVIGTVTI